MAEKHEMQRLNVDEEEGGASGTHGMPGIPLRGCLSRVYSFLARVMCWM